MNAKTKIAIAASVVVFTAIAVTAFSLRSRRDPAELTLWGNVDIRQVQLGFRVGGRIAEALVDEGDVVEAGRPLARIDAEPLRDAVHSAEAIVAQRTAVRDKMVAGPRAAEIALARAQLLEQQANLDDAQRDLARAEKLLPNGTVSRSVFDQANAKRNAASARVDSSIQSLRLLEDGYRAEDIAAAKADLAAAEAALSSARTSLSDTELRAPAGGVILSRVREPGAMITSSDVVYVLSLERPVWVRAYVAETALGRVHPGMKVTLTNDTRPKQPYRGTIGFVSPVAEFTPKSVETPELRTDLVYRLRIVVDDPDTGLRQGMPVTVHLPSETGGGDGR